MSKALVGHTGFVGATLNASDHFTHLFNSRNFREMVGEEYDEVVCAGISAVKWKANKEPEKDLGSIQTLLDVLATVKAKRFTLISTIDVYPQSDAGVNEDYVVSPDLLQPYGRHRLLVENFVKETFEKTLVVRLPGLYGVGLKKNIIFDLMSGNETEKINPATALQWYPTYRLSSDIRIAWKAGLEIANLFPAPIETADIIQGLFSHVKTASPELPAARYNICTRNAAVFGGKGQYIMDASEAYKQLEFFVKQAGTK